MCGLDSTEDNRMSPCPKNLATVEKPSDESSRSRMFFSESMAPVSHRARACAHVFVCLSGCVRAGIEEHARWLPTLCHGPLHLLPFVAFERGVLRLGVTVL